MKKLLLLSFLSVFFFKANAQEYRYYKAQMHCHSTNSDGVLTPEQVKSEYKTRGYEILFLTDHNFMSDIVPMTEPDFLCINAEELTFDKHMNGFFLKHTIQASGFTPQQAIDSVKAQGGLIAFNHPVKSIEGEDWSYTANQFVALDNLDLIEIHNWGTEFTLSPFNKLVWDSVLSTGRHIWGTATDDMHHLTEVVVPSIDRGYVMIRLSDLNPDSVYQAIKRGDFYATTGVEITNYEVKGDTIDIACSNCNKIQFIGDHGSVRQTTNSRNAEFIRTSDNYIRVYLEGGNGLFGTSSIYAWTQPHFFDSPSAVQENKDIVCQLTLYPNPVRDFAELVFTLKQNSRVKISILDQTGKEVKFLADKKLNSGSYSFAFDVDELNDGIYYLVLMANNQKLVKNFVRSK
ncbi:MAG: CehA/McbA family metallohydrolase [Bacteroidota bacterium]